MLKMIKARAAKKFAPSAAGLTPSPPYAGGGSRNLQFLSCAADVSSSRTRLASRRAKRSEQTIYHAATGKYLQTDFPPRRK
jgi:hypothetical protein